MYTSRSWHYKSDLRPATSSGLQVADGRRYGDTDGLEYLSAGAAALGADGKPLAFLFDDDLLERPEVLLDIGPLKAMAGRLDAPVQLLFEKESKETAKHVATDRIVPLMKHRPGLEKRLCVSEDLLNLPKLLVFERCLLGGKVGVGGEHPLSVKSLLFLHLLIVDGEGISFGLDVAPIAAVSNEFFCSALQLLFEGGNDCFPIRLVLSCLFGVEANDVAPAVYLDLFDLEGRRVLGGFALRVYLPVVSRIREDLLSDLLHFTHPHTQNVREPRLQIIQSSEGLTADHPPVGHQAEAGHLETLLDPLSHREQGLHIRGIARPHLATNGSAVAIKDRSHHHLVEIRSVILAKPPLPEALSTLAFEVEGGRIEEDKIEPREKVPLPPEQPLLDQILGAPGGKRCGILLIFGLFSEESHGPVKMVQRQSARLPNEVVASPFVAEPIGAADHEPVKHCEKHGSFHIEAEQPVRKKLPEHLSDPELRPKTLKDQSGTDLLCLGKEFALSRNHHQDLIGKPRKGPNDAFDVTLGVEPIKAAEGRHDSLNHLGSFSPVLNDLNILMWTGLLDTCKHGSLHYNLVLPEYFGPMPSTSKLIPIHGTTFLTLQKTSPRFHADLRLPEGLLGPSAVKDQYYFLDRVAGMLQSLKSPQCLCHNAS